METEPDQGRESGILGGKESTCNAGDLSLIPGWEDPLEKGMATRSSILAWRIPWTEEPGRRQSMESQRVGHDLVTKRPPQAKECQRSPENHQEVGERLGTDSS